jgi:hypothetical protein
MKIEWEVYLADTPAIYVKGQNLDDCLEEAVRIFLRRIKMAPLCLPRVSEKKVDETVPL